MVLTPIRFVLCVALLAGCKQSLFDSHGDVDARGGNGDGDIASSCPATCLADAAADFGMTKWAYLDDNKNRSWTPMTMASGSFTGGGANKITSCKNDGSAAACDALPGALLVTTTGSTSASDPALSYTVTSTHQVLQLTVRVHVPTGATEQTVRLYRNSREDSLLTGLAVPGATFERALTLDALKDDRFYLALSPTGEGSGPIGVHFYINSTQDSFPMTCQLGLQFSGPMGMMTDNACGVDMAYFNDTTAASWALGTPAFPELGTSADITMDRYFKGSDVISRSGDTTTQLWLRHDAFVSTYNTVVFSDVDLDYTGGVAIFILNDAAPKLHVETCTLATQTELGFASAAGTYPDDHAWHFIRVVHTNGMVKICLDGSRVASYVLPAGKMQSMYPPWLGRNLSWLPQGGFLDGAIDDVRVISGALPCE